MNLLPLLLALSLGHFAAGYVDSSGYEYLAGAKNAYRLHLERVPWDTANATCILEGGHLIVFDARNEIHIGILLFGRIPFFSPPMPWGYDLLHVGNNDKQKEGEWRSALGGLLKENVYNNWRPSEPNNWGNLEHCGAISRSGLFEDLKCKEDNLHLCPFICEKEISDEEFIDIRGSKD